MPCQSVSDNPQSLGSANQQPADCRIGVPKPRRGELEPIANQVIIRKQRPIVGNPPLRQIMTFGQQKSSMADEKGQQDT
jgi:hypothetical protein